MKIMDIVTPRSKLHKDHGNMFRIVEVKLWSPEEHMIVAYSIYYPETIIELPESELINWTEYM